MTQATVVKKTTMQIRTQKYAEIAYPKVESMRADKQIYKDEKEYKKKRELEAEYRTQALNLPTMILQSGLSQTIGFLMAKSKSDNENSAKPLAFQTILQHLESLLKDELQGQSLHHKIIKSNLTEYQLLTRKALEASSWLKRYTQALLRKKGDKDD